MSQKTKMVALLAIVMVMGFTHTIAAQETEVVEIKKGEVLRVVNNTVVVRVEGEGVKTFVVPSDFKFQQEGREITVSDLRPGNLLTGVRIRTTGGATTVDEEDIDKIMAEVAQAPAAAAEAVGDAAEAVGEMAESGAETTAGMAQSMGEDDDSVDDSVAEMAESAGETAEAAAADSGGMSPGLMIGLLLLALVLVVLAVKQLRKA